MRRGTERAFGLSASAVAIAAAMCVMAAPRTAAAQAQESIEIGRLELEDAREIQTCFRNYVRMPGRPAAAANLRLCVTSYHGRVQTVSIRAIRMRIRCLATAIRKVTLALARAEEHGVDDTLDEARSGLEECAIEAPAPATP